MVINLRANRRRQTADETGRIWWVGSYRRINLGARRYRVFVKGRDVTDSCFYVDGRRRIARGFVRDRDGQVQLNDTRNAARTIEWRGRGVKLRRRKVPL